MIILIDSKRSHYYYLAIYVPNLRREGKSDSAARRSESKRFRKSAETPDSTESERWGQFLQNIFLFGGRRKDGFTV